MSQMSNYLEEAILNAVFRGQAYTSPTTVYVALYTSNPTDEDIGTEVSATGTAYAREAVTFTAPTQVDGKATIENTADVVFAQATNNWGTITHVGLRDAATGGNLLFYAAVNNPREILTNDRIRFLIGEIVITLD